MIKKNINELPPVTPQQKTGHWIDGDCICPCCGEDKFKDLDADIWSDWQPNYCPNCGCRMVEPQESESKHYMELAKSYVQGLRAGLAESEGKK